MITDYLVTLRHDSSLNWHYHIQKILMHSLIVPAYVEIHLLHCPVGFDLQTYGACDCSAAIEDSVIGCSIDTMLIHRKASYWIGVELQKNMSYENFSTLYFIHEHCPFDFCKPGSFDFSLEDADSQCSHNRSRILCGKCKPGYSLILGGTECRQCTNINLLLLIPFALAGILLIVFLSLSDMTVAAGTINGLLFYVNILAQNKSAFFPPPTSESFLSVFIAWLNLDLGIKTCFFNGLDTYVHTWLQLAFPMYIWLLAFIIIIASRHVDFMNKLCGSNIVPVLATFFLLSYTKILKTITTSLSVTIIKVSNGNKLFVWLMDGNISYLQGKHIALFLVNVLLLFILLAYTLAIVFGPWLQRKTEYRVLCWVLKLKPLFDAYFGPLKDHHRYWTGVLLLSRIVLDLISAINVLGDDTINLLAIIIITFLLLSLLWQSGSVYKFKVLSLLDCFFFINLGILSATTLYDKYSSGSKTVTIYISTGSAFVVFCAIVFYHCFRRIKKHVATRHPLLEIEEHDSDDDMLNAIDNNR